MTKREKQAKVMASRLNKLLRKMPKTEDRAKSMSELAHSMDLTQGQVRRLVQPQLGKSGSIKCKGNTRARVYWLR